MILAIESGANFISVAIGDLDYCSTVKLATPRNSEQLLGIIDYLCSIRAHATIKEVAVCIGPGSYTGLRVGLACAQGIASGLEVPIIGISSFLVGLFSQKIEDGVVEANCGLRIGEVALCKFVVKEGGRVISQITQIECVESDQSDFQVVNAENLLKAADSIREFNELSSCQSHFIRTVASAPLPLMYIKPVQAKTLLERGLTSNP